MRPINALVDITNYVMLATGNPTHAFDADNISDHIVVRLAKEGEKLQLLNEKDLELTRRAVEAGKLIFTDVEVDAFTGDIGVVCAMPIYKDGELVAVVGSDLFLTSMQASVQESSS